ncbi:lytic transglycosylase domain-containing protein [Rhodobacteraceae bacterium NNCM2]|nr:lytic transglycosylase domain-containing protein [Coraliihabitans acroporae]
MTAGKWSVVAALICLLAPSAWAVEESAEEATEKAAPVTVDQICDLISAASEEHGLPKPFFTRLIWKESRFDIKAVSPVGAQGIAQFMPATAKIRGLADPFDPVQAIPASASYLADLRAQFGNWGLAAAAYNGGPTRVAAFVSKRGGLPYETRDYVQSITYRPAEWFRVKGRDVEPRPLDPKLEFDEACRQIPIVKTRSILAAASLLPWSVQIAAGINHRAAQQSYNRAVRRFRRIIGDLPPNIRRIKTGGVRRYIVRLGVPTHGEARKICARLQAAGGHCVVRRN